MRFLIDQNRSPRLADLLRDAGHDAVHTLELELEQAEDDDLVIPGYEHLSRTSWILSEHIDFEAAAENLADREGIRKPVNRRNSIHGITRDGETRVNTDATVADIVRAWLLDQEQLDAAVWTGLGPGRRWRDHSYASFSVDNALHYLAHLEGTRREAAAEYISKAPPEIDTPVRQRFMRLTNPN